MRGAQEDLVARVRLEGPDIQVADTDRAVVVAAAGERAAGVAGGRGDRRGQFYEMEAVISGAFRRGGVHHDGKRVGGWRPEGDAPFRGAGGGAATGFSELDAGGIENADARHEGVAAGQLCDPQLHEISHVGVKAPRV